MNNITIYKYTNKINNKVYIGQTSQTVKDRAGKDGRGYLTSRRFYNAIQKYGWANFQCDILYEHLSEEEADKIERELIERYKSTDENYGYNLQTGGVKNHTQSEETKQKIGKANSIALQGHHWSEERRQLMSEKFSGTGNPFYGKHHTEETKKLISEHRKGKASGKDHPFYGKKHSEEDLKKMSERRKGKGGKSVQCIETGENFNCMMDAARWCGLKLSCSIGQCCMGKVKSAGKHPDTKQPLHWRYIEKK